MALKPILISPKFLAVGVGLLLASHAFAQKVNLTESSGKTEVIEGGSSDNYAVVLGTQPSANVTITLNVNTAELGSDKTVLTFTPANWANAQTVTLTAVDDLLKEGLETSTVTHSAASSDSAYNGTFVPDVVVSIIDNDDTKAAVNITESSGKTEVIEGGTGDNYSLVLSTQPSADVIVTLSVDTAQLGATPTNLTFTPANWANAQTVTVTAVNDSVVEGSLISPISHAATSSDPDYNGLFVSQVFVSVVDNDSRKAAVDIAETGGNTVVTEGGTSDSYLVALSTQPSSAVTVTLSVNNAQLGSDKTVLTFTPVNWNTSQVVTVTAVDDHLDEGLHLSQISHTATSSDPDYNGLYVPDVVLSIVDNDTSGVSVMRTDGSTGVTEGGAGDTYLVVLNTQPSASVTVTLVVPTAQLGATPTNLTFTPANWANAQTVTVTAVDDNIDEGTHIALITHAVTSSDPLYDGISMAGVVVFVTDNDPNVVVDNNDGLARVSLQGAWSASVVAPGYWNTNYLHDQNVGKGTKSVAFRPNLPTGGVYAVSVWYPAQAINATNVPMDIVSVDGTRTMVVNQQVNGSRWYSIGTNLFNAGTNGCVTIRTTGTTNYVVADAVQFMWVTNPAPHAGTLQFADSTSSVSEAVGSVSLIVTRTGGSSGAAIVNFATVNGSALAGSDYTATNGILSWADGDSDNKTIVVPVINDSTPESNETFTVTLSSAGGATLGSPATATVTIPANDDPSGTLQLDRVSCTVGESAGTVALTVTRTGGSSGAASVNFAAVSGSALPVWDYIATNGILNWASGESAGKTVTVWIVNDSVPESNETFMVNLSGATGASQGSPTATTITIMDDEVPSITSVSPASMPASDSNQTFTINGSNFANGATLTFYPPTGGALGSTAAKLTFVSSSQIIYQLNNASDVGIWAVRVNNPNGQSSGTASFTVTAVVPPPLITSVSPASYPASANNQTMTINGSSFVSGATLTFAPPEGGTIASTAIKLTFVSSSQITYLFNNAGDIGIWTVRVNNPDGQSSGAVGFTVTNDVVSGDDSYEPDDSGPAAKPITNGETQARMISTGNVDWATFNLTAVGDVTVRTGARSGYTGGDTELWLYGPNSYAAQVAYNDDTNGTFWSQVVMTNLAVGTYYIRVQEYGNNASIPGYTLFASWTTPDDIYEPDDSGPAAKPIANGETQNRMISTGNVDWATFNLTAVGDVTVRTGARSGYTGGDTELWLYGPNSYAAQVAYNDDTNGTFWSQVVMTNLAVGTYYIRVQEYGNNASIPGYTLFASWTSASSPMVIVDNNDGSASVTMQGAWSTSTYTSGYWNVNYLHDQNTNKGAKSVTFRPNLPANGMYAVSVWYPAQSINAANVPMDIVSADGSRTAVVNQQVNGGQWFPIGSNTFFAGTNGYVMIRTAGTANYVLADAVKFAWVGVPFGDQRATNNVPKWWLTQHGLTNFNADAMGDIDCDGMPTWQEWVAGCNPTNCESVFKFTHATNMTSQGMIVRWMSISNRFYNVRRATNLFAGTNAFIILPGASNLPATPTENCYTDAVLGVGPYYYKIDVHE